MVRHLQPISQVMVVTGSLSSGRRDELVYPPIEQLIQNQLLSPRRTLKITDRKREICSLKFGTQLAHRTAESLAKPRIPTDSQSVHLDPSNRDRRQETDQIDVVREPRSLVWE